MSHSHFGTSESKSGRKVGPSAAVQTVNICRQMIFIEYQHTNTPDGRPEMLQLSFDFWLGPALFDRRRSHIINPLLIYEKFLHSPPAPANGQGKDFSRYSSRRAINMSSSTLHTRQRGGKADAWLARRWPIDATWAPADKGGVVDVSSWHTTAGDPKLKEWKAPPLADLIAIHQPST